MYHWRTVIGILRQLVLGVGLMLLTYGPLCDEPGPLDGLDLPAKALDRILVGQLAPDFILSTHTDGIFQLSEERGKSDVVLIFYRGHW